MSLPKLKARHGIFYSAITEDDGKSVNVGYLALFWVMVTVLGAVPLMCGLAVHACFKHPDKSNEYVQSLGIGIGAAAGGFSTALGALGLFLWGDRRGDKSASGVGN